MNSEESVYISLQEATQHCNYSQEYLSLRARQGKLKAVKFGRNWVTKKEWLEEYLKNVEEYQNNLNNKRFIAPPENLPIEETRYFDISKFRKPVPLIRFGFIVVLAFVLAITAIFHGKESFENVYQTGTPPVTEFSENFEREVVDVAKEVPQSFQFVYQEINSYLLTTGYQAAGVGEATAEVFQEYFQWLGRQYTKANNLVEQKLNNLGYQFSEMGQKMVQNYVKTNDSLEKAIAQDVNELVNGFNFLVSNVKRETFKIAQKAENIYQFITYPWRGIPEIPVVEKPVRPKPEEGAVIIPYPEEKKAEVKGKLEQAFSDKVEVTPDETGRAGIIRPLIKEVEAEEYLYLIVPVAE